MRIFVTGATGNLGSAVVCELIKAGHNVVGLTRSDIGTELLKKAGAEAHAGDLDDLESLRKGAANADGVIHLAFKHDFTNFENSLKTDLQAVQTIGEVLQGTNKPFIITNHVNGEMSENALFTLKDVRSAIISLPPTVHEVNGRLGFVSMLIEIARAKGFSGYVDDGSNRWPAVHRLDAANLYRLAIEKAPAYSQINGCAEVGVAFKDIAEVIGKQLGVPVNSISRKEAEAHFGFLGMLASHDISSTFRGNNVQTFELLGWKPEHPTLIDDLTNGHYFKN